MFSSRLARKVTRFMPALLLLMAPANGRAQETLDPIRWSIQLETRQEVLKSGDRLSVQVTAKIEDGWHLYSLDQEPGGPIPTRIRLPEDQPFKLADTIDSPAPRVEMDPNFNMETQFFEEEVTFVLPLAIAANTSSGKHQLKVNVTYQTCTATRCLPPKLVRLVADVAVSSAGTKQNAGAPRKTRGAEGSPSLRLRFSPRLCVN